MLERMLQSEVGLFALAVYVGLALINLLIGSRHNVSSNAMIGGGMLIALTLLWMYEYGVDTVLFSF